MQPSLRVIDFCILYGNSLTDIDVSKFIAFGLIHAFLRRVHKYPIRPERQRGIAAAKRATNTATGTRTNPTEMDIYSLMDGKHNTDEICCTHMLDYAELDIIAANDKHCFIVHK